MLSCKPCDVCAESVRHWILGHGHALNLLDLLYNPHPFDIVIHFLAFYFKVLLNPLADELVLDF